MGNYHRIIPCDATRAVFEYLLSTCSSKFFLSSDLGPRKTKRIANKPRKNVKVSDEMLDRVATRANMAKSDIDNLLELAEKYDKAFGDYKITKEFIASRLGAGSGILGVYALASED